jgi:hypothetical protein
MGRLCSRRAIEVRLGTFKINIVGERGPRTARPGGLITNDLAADAANRLP